MIMKLFIFLVIVFQFFAGILDPLGSIDTPNTKSFQDNDTRLRIVEIEQARQGEFQKGSNERMKIIDTKQNWIILILLSMAFISTTMAALRVRKNGDHIDTEYQIIIKAMAKKIGIDLDDLLKK